MNAKNRMGGYTGEQVFIVAYNGRVLDTRTESPEHDYIFQMCVRTKVALQKELEGVSQPVEAAKAGHSIAEEIEKLAALRDKGLLTNSEFNAQKIKLLNQVTPIN